MFTVQLIQEKKKRIILFVVEVRFEVKYWIDVNSNIDLSFILKEKRECSVMCLLSHRYVRMRVM